MNGFILASGTSNPSLLEHAKQIAYRIGAIGFFRKNSYKVPLASKYIQKVIDAGKPGYKKNNARC